jgi:flagellar basal-body rod protein FlgG
VDRDLVQGNIQNTGKTWDLALNGPGYFPLLDGAGKEVYTRAGNFRVDSEGRLVHKSGLLVAGGISVPNGTQNIHVAEDGTVTGNPPGSDRSVALGRIEVVGFADEGGLAARGQGVFDATDSSGPALRQSSSSGELGLGTIQQGALESSNVDKVQAMVDLINTQRAYETASKVITAADDMLGYANNLRR